MVSLKRAVRRRRQLKSILPRLKRDDPDLVELRLVREGVTDADVARLSSALASNTTVRLLDLSGNKITSRGARSLATALLSNESVEAVRLNGNPLGDEGVGSICQALANRSCGVGTLYLRRVGMGRYGAQALGATLVGAEVQPLPPTPRTAYEGGTNLTSPMDSMSSTIPSVNGDEALETGSSISGSVGSTVMVGGGSGASVAGDSAATDSTTVGGTPSSRDNTPRRSRARGIVHLDLADNPSIGNRGASALANALRSRSCRLRRLNLAGAGVRDAGAASLGSALASNRTLRHLDLYGNGVGDSGAERVAEALWFNRTIRTVNLGWNRMGNEGKSALGTALEGGNNAVIEHLFVSTTSTFSDPRGVVDLSHEEVRAEVKRVGMLEEEQMIRGRAGDEGRDGIARHESSSSGAASGRLPLTQSPARTVVGRSKSKSPMRTRSKSPMRSRSKSPMRSKVKSPGRKSPMISPANFVRKSGGSKGGGTAAAAAASSALSTEDGNRQSGARRQQGEASPAKRGKGKGKGGKGKAAAAASSSSAASPAAARRQGGKRRDESGDRKESSATKSKIKSAASAARPSSSSASAEKKRPAKKSAKKSQKKKSSSSRGSYNKNFEQDRHQEEHKSYGLERHPLDSDESEDEHGYDYDSPQEDENDENTNGRLSNQQRKPNRPQHRSKDSFSDQKPKAKPRGILRSPPLMRSPPPSLSSSSSPSSSRELRPSNYGGAVKSNAPDDSNSNNKTKNSSRRKKIQNGYVSDSSSSNDDQDADGGYGSTTDGEGSLTSAGKGSVDTADGTTIDYDSVKPVYSSASSVPRSRFGGRRAPVGMSGSLLEDSTSESDNGDDNGEESEAPFFTDDDDDDDDDDDEDDEVSDDDGDDDDDDVWGEVGESASGSWDAAAAVKNKTVWDASDLVAGDSYESDEDAPDTDNGGRSGKDKYTVHDDGDDDDDEDPFGRCHPDDDRLNVSELFDDSAGSGGDGEGRGSGLSVDRTLLDTPRKSNVTNPVVRMLMGEDDDDDASIDDISVDDNVMGGVMDGRMGDKKKIKMDGRMKDKSKSSQQSDAGEEAEAEAFELPPIKGPILPVAGEGFLDDDDDDNGSFDRTTRKEQGRVVEPITEEVDSGLDGTKNKDESKIKSKTPWNFGESARTKKKSSASAPSPSPLLTRHHRPPTPVGGPTKTTTDAAGTGVSRQLWDVRTVNRQIVDTSDAGLGPGPAGALVGGLSKWDSAKWGKGITPQGSDDGRGATPQGSGGNGGGSRHYTFASPHFSSPPTWDDAEAKNDSGTSQKAGDAMMEAREQAESSSPWGAVQRDWERGDDAEVDTVDADDLADNNIDEDDDDDDDDVLNVEVLERYRRDRQRRQHDESVAKRETPLEAPVLGVTLTAAAEVEDGTDVAEDAADGSSSSARLGIVRKDEEDEVSTITTASSTERKKESGGNSPSFSFSGASWSDLISSRSRSVGGSSENKPHSGASEPSSSEKLVDRTDGSASLPPPKTGAHPQEEAGTPQLSQEVNHQGSGQDMKDKHQRSSSKPKADDMESAALRWLEDESEDEEEEQDIPTRQEGPHRPVGSGIGSFSSEMDEDSDDDDGVDVDYDIEYTGGRTPLGATPRKSKDDREKTADEAVDALVGAMEKIGPQFLSAPRGAPKGVEGTTKTAGDEKIEVEEDEEDASTTGDELDGCNKILGGADEKAELELGRSESMADDGTLVLPWSPSAGEDSTGRMVTLDSSATQSLTLSATLSADSSDMHDSGSPRLAYVKGALTPMSFKIGESKNGRGDAGGYATVGEAAGLRTSRSWDQ